MYNFTRFRTTLFKNGTCSNIRHSSDQFVDVTKNAGMVLKSNNRASRKGKREKFKRCSYSEPILYQTAGNHLVHAPVKSTTKNTSKMSKPAAPNSNSRMNDQSYIINVFLKDQQMSKDGSINIRIKDADVNPEDISLEELTRNIQQNYPMMEKICQSNLTDLEMKDNKSIFVKKFERLWCDVFRQSKVNSNKVEANLLNMMRTNEIEEKVREDDYLTSNKVGDKRARKESVAEENSLIENAEGNKEELGDLNDPQRETMEDSSVVSSKAKETESENILSEDVENKMEQNLTVTPGKLDKGNRRQILTEDIENTIDLKTSVISNKQANEGENESEDKPQYGPEVASARTGEETKEQTLFEDSENEVGQKTFAISNEKISKETAKRLKSRVNYGPDVTSKTSRKRNEKILFDDSEHGIGKETALGTGKSDKEVSEKIATEEKEQQTSTENDPHEKEYTKDDHPIVSSTKIDDVEYDTILAQDFRTEGEENPKSSLKTRSKSKAKAPLKRMEYSNREDLNPEPISDQPKQTFFKQDNENIKEETATVSSTKINEPANEEVLMRNIEVEDEENKTKTSPRQMTYPILQDHFDPEPISDQSNKTSLEKILVEEQIVKSINKKSFHQDDENMENSTTLAEGQMVKSGNKKSFEGDENVESAPTASTVQLNEVTNKTLARDIGMEDEGERNNLQEISPPRKVKTFLNRMTYPVLQENLDPEPISDQSNKISLEKALVMDQINNNKNNRAPEPVISHSLKKMNDKEKAIVNKLPENKKRIPNIRPTLNNPERLKRLNGKNKKQVEAVIKLASARQPETTLGKIASFCKRLFKDEQVETEDAEMIKDENFIDRTTQPKKLCIPQKNTYDMQYRFFAPQRNEPEYKMNNSKPRKQSAGSMETITNDAIFQQKCGVRERILPTRNGKFKNTQRKTQYSTQNFLNKTFNNVKERSQCNDAKEMLRDPFIGMNLKVYDEQKRSYSNKGSCKEENHGGDGKSETEVICETNRCESPKDIEDIEKGVSGATSKCLAIRNPDKPAEPLPMEEPCDEKDDCDPRWKSVVKPAVPKFNIMDHIGDLADNDPSGDIENYYGKSGYKNLEYYKYRPCSYYDILRYMAKKRNPQPDPFSHKRKHKKEDSC